MNFEGLGWLSHDRNHRLNRWTSGLMALQLADGDGHIGRQIQDVLGPGFELLDVLRLGGRTLLFEEVHGESG